MDGGLPTLFWYIFFPTCSALRQMQFLRMSNCLPVSGAASWYSVLFTRHIFHSAWWELLLVFCGKFWSKTFLIWCFCFITKHQPITCEKKSKANHSSIWFGLLFSYLLLFHSRCVSQLLYYFFYIIFRCIGFGNIIDSLYLQKNPVLHVQITWNTGSFYLSN